MSLSINALVQSLLSPKKWGEAKGVAQIVLHLPSTQEVLGSTSSTPNPQEKVHGCGSGVEHTCARPWVQASAPSKTNFLVLQCRL